MVAEVRSIQGIKHRSMLNKIVKNIRYYRTQKKISQDEIAKSLGISQNGYSKIELGCTKITLIRLFEIIEILEIPFEKLLDEKELQKDWNKTTQYQDHARVSGRRNKMAVQKSSAG